VHPTDEVIVRPDFDAVITDERNRELIEEFENEAKTRTFTGWWARFVTSLSVATTLFALYYAAAGAEIPFTSFVLVPSISVFGQTITTKQIYEMIFLAAILVLSYVLYPAHPRFLKRVNPFLDLIPGSVGHVFAGASHCTHIEQPEEFRAVIARFLETHDPQQHDQ